MYTALSDPLTTLAGDCFAWDAQNQLSLNDRYRTRHLPVMHENPRRALGTDTGPGEFWPPVRSLVLPIDDTALRADPTVAAFLHDLRELPIWWPGLQLRSPKVHATLIQMPALPEVAPTVPIDVEVLGPWIGTFNTGRIDLPVRAATSTAEHQLERYTSGPLLAGYLQLTDELTGTGYTQFRQIIKHYGTRVRVPMTVSELWLTDTMDDLVLRSRIHARLSCGRRA